MDGINGIISEIRNRYYDKECNWIRTQKLSSLRLEYKEKLASFIQDDLLLEFDFSNDCANKMYTEIPDSIDRYMLYKLSAIRKTRYQEVERYKEENLRLLKKIIDPDTESFLLQEIYKILYFDIYEDSIFLRRDNVLQGETMNSIQFTLNTYLEYLLERKEFDLEKIGSEINGRVSFTSLMYIYITQKKAIIDALTKIGVVELMKVYHTLGNFIMIPIGCNCPRANCLLKDYWDLTLACIYNWYAMKDNQLDRIRKKVGEDEEIEYNIVMIFQKEEDLQRYIRWLSLFGTWDEFVKQNYLGDEDELENFVIKKGENYGRPKELWRGHFTSSVKPSTEGEFKEYFENASKWILTRGKAMHRKLKGLNYKNEE